MSLELGTDERYPDVLAGLQRAAAVHVADRIAAQHPHELDELMPRLAGRQLAKDPAIAAEIREHLDVLGLMPSKEGPNA